MNKIEKIKKALDEATPNWHDNGNEIVSRNNPNMGIGGFLKEEDNHLAANAPEWLRWQQSRIEQLEKTLQDLKLLMHDGHKNGYESETVFWSRCIWEIDQAIEGSETK